MKKRFLAFPGLLLAAYISLGCGYFADPESYQVVLFRKETIANSALHPFAYDPRPLGEKNAPTTKDYEKNCKEWQAILGDNVKLKDIDFLLYKVPLATFMEWLSENKCEEYLGHNTFFRALQLMPKHWEYFVFAKLVERAHCCEDIKYWRGRPYEVYSNLKNPFLQSKEVLIRRAEIALRTQKDDFLKKRYAYQLIVLHWLIDDVSACAKLYDRYFGNWDNPDTVLDTWAAIFKVYQQYRRQNFGTANYMAYKIFKQSDYKKIRAYHVFDPKPESVKSALAMCKNDEEKSDILALKIMQNPGKCLETIKEIYALNSKNEYLDLLFSREINKIEDWIYTTEFTKFEPSLAISWRDETYDYYSGLSYAQHYAEKNRAKDIAYMRELRTWLETHTRMHNNDFRQLAIAQLYILDDQPKLAKAALTNISQNAPLGILQQKATSEVLLSIWHDDIQNQEVQTALGQAFLDMRQKWGIADKPVASMLMALSNRFQKLGDGAMTSLCYTKSPLEKNEYVNNNAHAVYIGTIYLRWDEPFWEKKRKDQEYYTKYYYSLIGYLDIKGTPKDVDKMLGFVKNGAGTNKLLQFLLLQQLPSEYALLDLKGMMHFREDDMAAAAKAVKNLPDDYWDNHYKFSNFIHANPFDCEPNIYELFAVQKKSSVNKKTIYNTFLKLKNNPTPENCIKLGNAYYQSTWHGNSWMLFKFAWSVHDGPNKRLAKPAGENCMAYDIKYDDPYFGCSRAIEWYLKAAESKDKEIASKATLYALNCQYKKSEFGGGSDDYYKKNPTLLLNLRDKYGDTEAFLIIKNCPGAEEYLGR